ncbi:dTDP-4-dehydrorhamnose reductase family protein [Streptomyces sp. NPDC055089]
MKVVIFGASGVLGRSLLRSGFEDVSVAGFGFSRTGPGLTALDATEYGTVLRVLGRLRPDLVVNCVGERRPEVWSAEPSRAYQLNVHSARVIADCAQRTGARLIHVSSDYVFDGTAPPYRPDRLPNPLNAYGRWKLEAEQAVREVCPDVAILRLPVLYGPAQYAAETNLTQIAAQVGAGDDVELDDVCVRYPTHVYEAAEVCRRLGALMLLGRQLGSVNHWSAQDGYTKFAMGVLIARRFSLPAGNLRAGSVDATAGDRPVDCRLDRAGLPAALGWPPVRPRRFQEELASVAAPWVTALRSLPTFQEEKT